MTAQNVIATAKQHGIKGVFIKAFRNGQELRSYSVPTTDGKNWTGNIRATAAEHA